jgi:hypothetical protein
MPGELRRVVGDAPDQYDRLLATSISVHADYRTFLGQAFDLERGSKRDDGTALREGLREIEGRIAANLAARVQLLRRLGRLRTIDDAMRLPDPKDAAAKDVATILSPSEETASRTKSVRARAKLVSPDAEQRTFRQARRALATEMGYSVEEDDAEWLTLHRRGVTIEMRQTLYPDARGVSGNDRIAEMTVYVDTKRGRRTVFEYGPLEHGLLPCVDPKAQEEIDRAVAIFG